MIENRDFEKLIKQYDHKDAFFYCDPPYTSGCGYDVTTTEGFDHERLRDTLKNAAPFSRNCYIETQFLLLFIEKSYGFLIKIKHLNEKE